MNHRICVDNCVSVLRSIKEEYIKLDFSQNLVWNEKKSSVCSFFGKAIQLANCNCWLDLAKNRISHSQFEFAKYIGSLRMSFYIFSVNCVSLKSDISRIFRVNHRTSYIGSYFKPNKYPMFNNNVISQRFIVHINFKSHSSFFSITLLRSNKL